ncbi:hypothetical protein [Streptococcus sp. HMSC067H01]|uniref:hypothetical protein n=1 Tax=Streptococcus sp. HMSC067H01 TaxID=1739491 RepID=UPI0009F34534|nr:hypothetical protein [Streptococcus sp. HMSC067H01]
MPYVDGNYVSFIYNLQQSPRLLKLCGGGTTKSNSNELPISVPLSFACFCSWGSFSSTISQSR